MPLSNIMLVTNGTGPVLIIGGKLEIISLRPNSKLNRPQTLTIRLFRLFCPDLGADQSIFPDYYPTSTLINLTSRELPHVLLSPALAFYLHLMIL